MKNNNVFKVIVILSSLVFMASCSQSNSPQSERGIAGNIVGGKDASLDFQKQNGVVGLYIISEDMFGGQSVSICTGSLLTPKVVLTAAHCVLSGDVKQIFVVFDTKFENITDKNIRAATNVYVHEDWVGDVNDLAMFALNAPAPEGFKVANLPLAAAPALTEKDKFTFAGYGVAVALVNKLVVDPKTGEKSIQPLPTPDGKDSGILRYVDNMKFIESSPDGKEMMFDEEGGQKGSCHGDSGGPAYLKKADGTHVLVGVASRVTNEIGNCNEEIIYTDVKSYLDWISSSIKLVTDYKPAPPTPVKPPADEPKKPVTPAPVTPKP